MKFQLLPSGMTVSALIVLTTYSGTIKWLPIFALDPTILFSILLIIIISIKSFKGLPCIRFNIIFALGIFILMHALYLISSIYTSSWNYWVLKFQILLLNLICLIAPIILIRKPEHLHSLIFCIRCFSMFFTFLVIGLYAYGEVDIIFLASNSDQIKFPDYLVLGVIIGIGVIINIFRNTVLSFLFASLGISALLLLGGRGPIIFTILSILFGYFYFREGNNFKIIGVARFFIISIVFILALFYWSGADLLVQRFIATYYESDELYKGVRSHEFNIALGVISNNPFFGVGLGGYGIAGYDEDADIYPHNLFLESWAEGGVITFILFSLGIFLTITQGHFIKIREKHFPIQILLIFLILNYLKSGGFVGSRDLWMYVGCLFAYINCIQKSSVK